MPIILLLHDRLCYSESFNVTEHNLSMLILNGRNEKMKALPQNTTRGSLLDYFKVEKEGKEYSQGAVDKYAISDGGALLQPNLT